MKIKIFALVMVLVMLLGILAGCKPVDPGTSDPGNGGGGDTPTPPTPPNPDDPVNPYHDIYWTEEDTFIFSLTENSNNQELPSTCARYIAGNRDKGIPAEEMADIIDDMVLERNEAAIKTTKVRPLYSYIPEDKEHGWGRNIEAMVGDMSTYVPGYTPDVYCNFVYDMVAASLSGAFANLKTSTMVTDGQVRKNWFQFTDPRYVDDGTGYMVEYMRSLSLSRNKQYCLSSDYFTDMVRAFFVVPVNIQLLETFPLVDTEGAFNYDYIADGEYTIEDFYEFVYTGKWSYATLAEISQVYNFHVSDGKNATDDPNGDLDDRLIFAIAESSGLSASGMLYTTSVTIIEREMTEKTDGQGNKYSDYLYYYPASSDDIHMGEAGYVPASQSLFAFCDALTSLMSENKGIISITNDQAGVYHPGDALLAIRNRFVNNRILFGGAICLGSLEYTEYRDMEDGFGVVPVPLYRTEDENGVAEKYMTQIHNIGRIGAINAKTTKFAKISAYLDYQSLNSTDVLEEYYEVKLCGDVAGGGAHKLMLQYIRSDVRTSFDKAFEDAIGYLFVNESVSGGGDSDAAAISSEKQKWHALIMAAHFECDAGEMSNYYLSYVEDKKGRLDSLEESYVGLPA